MYTFIKSSTRGLPAWLIMYITLHLGRLISATLSVSAIQATVYLRTLHAAGRLPIKRAVIDSRHITKQVDLIKCLKSSGAELILDLKTVELSFQGGF